MSDSTAERFAAPELFVQRHLRLGWLFLLLFLTLGIVLELMHAFKLGYYLDAANQTRRFLWTLAHAHGSLLSLLLMGFAFTARMMPEWRGRSRTVASRCLVGATVLLPLGFFLGGVGIHGGDPGPGIVLAAPGGLLLLVGVLVTALRHGLRGAAAPPNPAA